MTSLLIMRISRDRLKRYEMALVRHGAATDLTKWRLTNERGRQTWLYDENGESGRESNFIEKHSLGLDTVGPTIYVSKY